MKLNPVTVSNQLYFLITIPTPHLESWHIVHDVSLPYSTIGGINIIYNTLSTHAYQPTTNQQKVSYCRTESRHPRQQIIVISFKRRKKEDSETEDVSNQQRKAHAKQVNLLSNILFSPLRGTESK